jgi:hypothetical protein
MSCRFLARERTRSISERLRAFSRGVAEIVNL